jgi:hypothetical protein
MLTERQKKRDCQSSPKDWVKYWMFKRKKYTPPAEEHSQRNEERGQDIKQLVGRLLDKLRWDQP